MMEVFKKILRRLLGWYVEPVYEENRRLRMLIEDLTERVSSADRRMGERDSQLKDLEKREELTQNHLEEQETRTRERFEEQDKRFAGIEERETRTRGRFEEQDKRFAGIEEREAWTRGRFEEQDKRFAGIEEREAWTRGRFEEQDKRFAGIEEREAWTRGRFEEQDKRFAGIEERENWTRKRFEGHDTQLNQLRRAVSQLQMSGGTAEENGIAERSYSQSGEDAISAYLLSFLGKLAWEITYLDLGANHPKELSNTYYFYKMGGHGVLVEANPELIPELLKERPGDIVLNVAVGEDPGEKTNFYVISGDGLSTTSLECAQEVCRENPELFIKSQYELETRTVNQILREYFPEPPTILSVDLEGLDEMILHSIDYEKYSPWIIIMEDIPYTPLLSVDQREFRCVEFLRSKGYTEYAFTGINSIFVLKKVVEEFNERRRRELNSEARNDGV